MKSRRKLLIRILLAAAVAILVTTTEPPQASAETVKTRRSARVYVKPGEQSKVTANLKKGKSLVVLGRKGRWLKVKVGGRVGWIVRTNVEAEKSEKKTKTRKTRKRGFVSGRGTRRDRPPRSAPSDRIGISATGGVDEDEFEIADDEEPVVPTTTKKKKKKKKKTKARGGKKKVRKQAKRAEKSSKAKKRAKRAAKKKAKKADDDDEEEDPDFDDDDDLAEDDDDFPTDDDEFDDDEFDDDEFDDDEFEDEDEDGEADSAARRARAERPTVVALSAVELRERRSRKADEVATASAGDELVVVDRAGRWIRVETTEGDTGWVREGDVGEPGYRYEELELRAHAALGYARYSQSFSSDSAMLFGNYDVASGAMALTVGAELLHDYSPKYLLGAEVQLRYALSTPGIRVDNGAGSVDDTGFQVIEGELMAKGGYKLHPGTGTAAFARLGYQYHSFQIKNVNDLDTDNLASLPSESLKGLVVGVGIAAPRLTEKLAARLDLDTMFVLTARAQTTGLEDGQVSRAKAINIRASLGYDYDPDFKLLASYHYGWAKTSWDGRATGSMRKHDATTAERSDAAHIISLGILRDF